MAVRVPVTHWPQPLAAVEQALRQLPATADWAASREAVWREVRQKQNQPQLSVHLRGHDEGLAGFDENYTPGSSVTLKTDEGRWGTGDVTAALKLGGRVEQNSNSLLAQSSGSGLDGAMQVRPDDSAAVLGLWGWNVQAFGHRVFVEYADTNVPQLDNKSAVEPAYLNGYYRQGYTNGARWIGSAQGGGSRVTTLGWLDAHRNMLIKVHRGTVGLSVGAYDPDVNAPKGTLTGLSARRTFDMYRWRLTPELSIMQLSAGQDVGVNKRTNVRLGMEIQIFL